MKRKTTYAQGLNAERWAAIFLRLKGYRILNMRYKTRFGEIDIVARRGKVLACVEVKYRPGHIASIEAVGPRSRQRIQAAAEHYIATHRLPEGISVRFDIIAVNPPFYIRHFPQAWYI